MYQDQEAKGYFFLSFVLLFDFFFQSAPAPASDFLPSGSGSWYFFPAAPAPAQRGQKNSSFWLLVKFGKIFFSLQTSEVKLQKNK